MILVLDFGSQYTQLIAKSLRRLGYSSEVIPGLMPMADYKKDIAQVSGVILSGSPASVGGDSKPDLRWLELGKPLLGICFGFQFLATHFGGKISSQTHREYGAARLSLSPDGRQDPLTKKLKGETIFWMSHGDSVTNLPPNSQVLLESKGKAAAFRLGDRPVWGLQFHPEVYHSEEGDLILEAFAEGICRNKKDWSLKSALDDCRSRLAEQLKDVPEVICGVSGGVDSTVMAVLLGEFTQVKAFFVDHGFQRSYDLPDLKKTFSHHPNIELEVIDAEENFWTQLEGVHDPESKRKIMGRLFIESFYSKIKDQNSAYLGQGTIYSDVIESAQGEYAMAHKIKSHHNVGGLPEDLKFKLVEPLRNFFKDEVREIGALLGIDKEFLQRHPFPGPGLSIRCVGALTRERIAVLRLVDAIFYEELVARNLYGQTWQAAAILLPVSTVGVMGDGRSYESVVALRAVSSIDAMTADASDFPMSDLKEIASRIVNEVRGVNRVVFDLTSKPPSTIEWE